MVLDKRFIMDKSYELNDEYALSNDEDELNVICSVISCNMNLDECYDDLIKNILINKIHTNRISEGIEFIDYSGKYTSIYEKITGSSFSSIDVDFEIMQTLPEAFVDLINIFKRKDTSFINLEEVFLYATTGLVTLENDRYPYLIDIDILREIKNMIQVIEHVNNASNLELLDMYRINTDERIKREILRRMKMED